MPTHPPVVTELRAMFKAGATPSALVRRIADRHPGEPGLDVLVREYFREAFRVPTVRVGPEQVRAVAAGGSLPGLNLTVLHHMIRTRPEWDRPDGETEGCWLDGVTATDEAALIASAEPAAVPELAGSWDRMDDDAKQFIRRVIGNSRALSERANAAAALAERLQQRTGAGFRRARGA